MSARVVEVVTWRGRGPSVPGARCEGCTRGCAMWTGDVCLVEGEGFAGCKWVARREVGDERREDANAKMAGAGAGERADEAQMVRIDW